MNKEEFMKGKKTVQFILLLWLISAIGLYSQGNKEEDFNPPELQKIEPMDSSILETAVFAGGCFWGVEAVFEVLDGVYDSRSGYAGGSEETATYNRVSSGRTDHAEAVEIRYDPDIISYETLLEVFFTVAHDPTQLNYQGPDRGSQYRSAIFYVNQEQQETARNYIEKLEAQKVYKDPVVTQLTELPRFYPAEEYHQDYLWLNPDQPYIVYWDLPKLQHLFQDYSELVAEEYKE